MFLLSYHFFFFFLFKPSFRFSKCGLLVWVCLFWLSNGGAKTPIVWQPRKIGVLLPSFIHSQLPDNIDQCISRCWAVCMRTRTFEQESSIFKRFCFQLPTIWSKSTSQPLLSKHEWPSSTSKRHIVSESGCNPWPSLTLPYVGLH